MFILHKKLTHKTPSSQSLLYLTARFLNAPKPEPFPDEPTSAYYDRAINLAGQARDFAAVYHLLDKRFKDGFFNTNNTFKFITNGLTDFSTVLDELYRTLARLDKGFCRKSAYDSLIARLCKLNRVAESVRVVDAINREGHGCNACTFHPILNALTRRKEMEEALRMMGSMREIGITPDVTAYNYLLTAYCFTGDLTAAADVLREMEEQGLGADSRTYDALVLGACRAGKVEGALVVLRRMEDAGLPVLYSSHAHVISALLRKSYYAQAVEFVRSYGGRDMGLDTENFGCLANRLINLRRFEDAKLVLEDLYKRGLPMGSKLKEFYSKHVEVKE